MSTVKIKPLSDRVVIEQEKLPEVLETGIFIPGTVKEKPYRGTVVAAGPGTKTKPMTVVPGDKVIYHKQAGMSYKEEGVEYLIMRETDILSVI